MKNSKDIPKGYKQSPVGLIPQDWEVKKLKDLGEISSGTTPSRKNEGYYKGGNIPWVKTTDLTNGFITLTEECVTEVASKECSLKMMPKGTILIAMYGGFNQIGRTGLLEIDATVNQAISGIVLYGNRYNNYYILQYLNANVNRWKRYAASSRKDPNITGRDVANFKIAIPPTSEQQKIAEILSTWDKAIELQTAIIDKLILRKKGLMQQLLSGKKRLKGFIEPWKQIMYGDLLKEIRRDIQWDDNERYDLISVKRRSEGIFRRESLLGKDILTKSLGIVREGDFIISKMQIVHGASAMVTSEFDGAKVSGSYIILVPKKRGELNMGFFNYWSQMPRFYHQTFLSSYGVHIEKMTFDINAFLSHTMNLPAISEQCAIADILTIVDDETQKEKQKLEALKQQKKGLMQQLLTGKRRV